LFPARFVGQTAAAAAVVTTLTAGHTAARRRGYRGYQVACVSEQPAVSCGTLTLPIDWSNPGGATFELAVSRRPAGDSVRRVGALLVNPGGSRRLRHRLRVRGRIAFQPRVAAALRHHRRRPLGVAPSHCVVCSTEALSRPGDTPLPRSQADYTGPLYDHVDSISVARDLDAGHAAPGEATLHWYGASYGTLMMGQMYDVLFPGRAFGAPNPGRFTDLEALACGLPLIIEDGCRRPRVSSSTSPGVPPPDSALPCRRSAR
jgi:hypothetical protein